jgi:lysophospholipase L1-like esterase
MAYMESRYKKRTHDTHMNRHLPYVKDEKKHVDIVLLGTSHFERLVWFNADVRKQLPRKVFVAGVGGDRVEHILYRLESKDGLLYAFNQRKNKPKKIILLAGGNNLLSNYSSADKPAEIVEKMKYVINYIRKELPDTYLEVWAIPRNEENSPEIEEYNTLLEKMCEEEQVPFSKEVYKKTKQHPNTIFHDGCHLSKEGYMKCMIPSIRKL